MEENNEDTVQLGGNIELTGFSEIDGGSAVILKKIVGNYARRFSDNLTGFESLSLVMKTIHDNGNSKKYELKAKALVSGNIKNAEITDRNLFVAADSVLKKLENALKN